MNQLSIDVIHMHAADFLQICSATAAGSQKNEGMPDAHGEYQPIPLQNRSKTIKHAEKHIEFIELPQREM